MKGQDEAANVWICDAHGSMNGVGSSAKAVVVNLVCRWTESNMTEDSGPSPAVNQVIHFISLSVSQQI